MSIFFLTTLQFSGCVPLIITPDPNVLYIAFGDSSTAGPTMPTYPDQLQVKLGVPPETFTNQGNSGETTEEGLRRLTADQTFSAFPNAEFFLYWEGGNDVADFIGSHDPLLLLSPDDPNYPFATALEATLDTVESNIGQAIRNATDESLNVYVATYFPLSPGTSSCGLLAFDVLLPNQAAKVQGYLDMLNDRIRNVAITHSANLVDVATLGAQLLADPANYFDCNHLTVQGNDIVTDLFLSVITSNP